ncbi:MAG: hypothetical protein V4702_06415 [Patescibacteria group bacterium]
MSTDDTKLLMEYFDDKVEKILDGVEAVIDKKVRVIVQEELVPIKADIRIIKAAVTATNQDVQNLKSRVTVLETT